MRWVWNLRARSSAPSVQRVRWVCILRARSSALSMQGVRVEQMTSVVKRRTNRDSAIAPRFIVNFYQLYRLLDRRRQPRASPPPVPPPPPSPPSSHSLFLANSSWQHRLHSGGLPPTTGRNGTRVDTPHRLHGPSQTRTCLRRSVSRRSSVGNQPVRVGTENVLLSSASRPWSCSRLMGTDEAATLSSPTTLEALDVEREYGRLSGGRGRREEDALTPP